ncbi:hypothetical protein Nepgr_017441 [Nepenthes gracilis]|uniref:Uncharacterized protein n=1 Tax=Nepenthes gracilis TaxID=150966 RepID=A0AAD3XTD2_NEPGR|nr:hypothetical protein Nepgr_017441 [Nepenthes gracilis]
MLSSIACLVDAGLPCCMELLKHGQLNGDEAGWLPPEDVYWAITSLSSAEAGSGCKAWTTVRCIAPQDAPAF